MVRRINLVPAAERRRTQTDVGLLALVIAGVFVVGSMAFSYFYFSGVASDKEMELALVQTQRQQVEAQLASLAEFEALQLQVQSNESLVQQVYAGRTMIAEILGDLSLVVPSEVWFESLELTAPPLTSPADPAVLASGGAEAGPKGSLTLGGTTYTFEDVAELLVRLDQLGSLGGIALGNADSSQIGDRKVKSFSVMGELVNTQSPTTPLPVTEVEVKG